MPAVVKCPNCGAKAKKGDGRFCSHCGGSFPDVPRVTPDEWATHPQRFDKAEASDWVKRAQTLPAPSVSMAAVVLPVLFLCAWIAMGAFMFSNGPEGIFLVGLITIMSGGVIGILIVIREAVRFIRAPIERCVAVVIDERVEVRGGGEDSSATTHYFVTIVGRDGERTECETTPEVAGLVTAGDIGLAVKRLRTLVAFHRS